MTEEKKKKPLGPTGEQVRVNVARIREDRGLSKKELSSRVADLGRPIPPLGISRIEAGDRRVDADDLVALAVALNVSPLALLLPPDRGFDPYIALTGENPITTLSRAWRWASGVSALPDELGEDAPADKQDDYARLSQSKGQRYVKRQPAGRAVDVLHDEVYRLVEISEISSESTDKEFARRLGGVRAWLDRLAAEVDRAAEQQSELSRQGRQLLEGNQRPAGAGESDG